LGKAREGKPVKSEQEKHTAFFRFVEACAQAECPLCCLVRRRLEQFFDGLLYEKVNDPELRKRLRTAGGFCNPHSFQFLAYHDGLAGSILYRDLLEAWIAQGLDFPVQHTSGLLPGCPACSQKVSTEEIYLGLIAKCLNDGQLKAGLLASDGFCLFHLKALALQLQRGKQAMPEWLLEFQRGIASRLSAELGAYIDSSNFSLGCEKPPLNRQQELAWQRAVRKFAGFPAVP
jgi:hypothetical protein